jgi:hypothetical protein
MGVGISATIGAPSAGWRRLDDGLARFNKSLVHAHRDPHALAEADAALAAHLDFQEALPAPCVLRHEARANNFPDQTPD